MWYVMGQPLREEEGSRNLWIGWWCPHQWKMHVDVALGGINTVEHCWLMAARGSKLPSQAPGCRQTLLGLGGGGTAAANARKQAKQAGPCLVLTWFGVPGSRGGSFVAVLVLNLFKGVCHGTVCLSVLVLFQ